MIGIFNFLSFASSFKFGWSKAWPIIFAILFFGFIIFIHELGHFLTAKWMGVKVNEFAIGMGPKLLKFGKKETAYSLRAFPIGGFVSMEGEDEDSEDKHSFNNKPVWRRIIIVVAGAFMNILLGLVLMGIILSQQNLIGTTRIAKFQENAKSSSYGLKAGDRIISINGMRTFSSKDVSIGFMRDKDGILNFVVERNGKKVEVDNVKFDTEKVQKTTVIKYDFYLQGLHRSFWNITKYSFLETLSLARLVWISLIDLFTGHFGFSELAGPIGTVGIIAKATSQGLETVLLLMAFITINIGVFNLLPLPALDGGRLFLLIVEGIRRKPINRKYEAYINAAGLALLMLLMVAVSFNDISNLIKG